MNTEQHEKSPQPSPSQLLAKMETLTVEVLLSYRQQAMMTSAFNPLKFWEQLQDRVRMATRKSTSPEEWATDLARSLKLGSPIASTCSALTELVSFLNENNLVSDWLTKLESEYMYLIALTRSIDEKRREAKKASKLVAEEGATHGV